MKIFLTDRQKWILITKTEAKRLINSGLERFTRENIQPYLSY